MIITIDGPAASGKGTLAKKIAAHFGLPHLDTGLLYRGVAAIMLDRGFDLHNEEIAHTIAQALDVADLHPDRLRGAAMGEAASIVASHPSVRQALLQVQRAFAEQLDGAVLDGRDIGTVICPQAQAKLFVTASARIRAQRRFLEAQQRGEEVTFEQILADIEQRDQRDSTRAVAPLKIADNTLLLDTSNLGIEAAFLTALDLIKSCQTKANT